MFISRLLIESGVDLQNLYLVKVTEGAFGLLWKSRRLSLL